MTRGISCTYDLVEAAAAAALQPPPLRCLPPAPRYVFAPDNSLKHMTPANSFTMSSGTSRPRRSINTTFQESPYAMQCTSDSAAAAKLAKGGALPPLTSLPSMRNSSHHSSSEFNLPSLPSSTSGMSYTSLNPSLHLNMRSGSWSQVENALPPLDPSASSFSSLYSSQGGQRSIPGGYPSDSFGDLAVPPLPGMSRPGTPSRGLRRSSSTASLSSFSDWNSVSKTPSLSIDGSSSRRSASSELDDHFGMPGTASSFGLESPFNSASTNSGLSRPQKPMFGYNAPGLPASPYGVHAPSRSGSIDPLSGLNLIASTQTTNGFRGLISADYPSASAYTSGYSSGPLDGVPSRSSSGQFGANMGSSRTDTLGYPSSSGRRVGIAPPPFRGVAPPSSMPGYPQSPANTRDSLMRGQGRRLSRNASYAGLSSYEASGW